MASYNLRTVHLHPACLSETFVSCVKEIHSGTSMESEPGSGPGRVSRNLQCSSLTMRWKNNQQGRRDWWVNMTPTRSSMNAFSNLAYPSPPTPVSWLSWPHNFSVFFLLGRRSSRSFFFHYPISDLKQCQHLSSPELANLIRSSWCQSSSIYTYMHSNLACLPTETTRNIQYNIPCSAHWRWDDQDCFRSGHSCHQLCPQVSLDARFRSTQSQ